MNTLSPYKDRYPPVFNCPGDLHLAITTKGSTLSENGAVRIDMSVASECYGQNKNTPTPNK